MEFQSIERFVTILYDRTSNETTANSARLELFTRKNRSLENIPPTQAKIDYILCWNMTSFPRHKGI